MKKISLTVAALGLAMMLVCPETFAQNRRTSTEQNTNTTTTTTTTTTTRSTATQPASQTTTNTGTTTTRRTSGTASQPASTTTQTTQTTTRQTTTTPSRQTTTTTSTPSRQTTTTQPSTTTTTNTATAPGGRRNSTTTTTTSQPTTTTETKQSVQPQKPANQTATQPANQPTNNGGTTMRPGGSTTHQNSNGNVTRPNGKTPTTGQPQNYKPEPQTTKGGQPITPGYRPDALKVKPPKQPTYHSHYHGKPAPPKAFFDMGYHMYGTRINTLPKGHTIRYVNKVKYYYYNGVFYRANNLSGYIITRPPKGYNFDAYSVIFCPIPVLIDPYRDQAVRIAEASSLAKLYARYYPSYRPMDDSYYINNVLSSTTHQYYHNDGSYFIESGGRFSVVDAPLGALTDRLPYDYEEVYLGNDLFYLVDNILYGVVCPEGIPYFEVFCVL